MKYLYLSHHGIKGQKWGDRNGPPYPLKAGAHSAAENRANVKYGRMYVAGGEDTKYNIDSLKSGTSSSGLKRKNAASSIEEDMNAVNPGYPNTDNNCTNCVMTYTLRRMGLDVEALPRKDERLGSEMDRIFEGCLDDEHSRTTVTSRKKYNTERLVEDAIKDLCKDKTGVGFVAVTDGFGHGHVFNWEQTNGGKIVFVDTQMRSISKKSKHGVWTSNSVPSQCFNMVNEGWLSPHVTVSRLDNCKVNKNALKDVCRNC